MWNNISNKNATTVEKLAQGMAKAGSTANAFGLDMDQLNAIIGTVTAATKQSGKFILAPYISDNVSKPRICWKLLKLTVPKCDNLLDGNNGQSAGIAL